MTSLNNFKIFMSVCVCMFSYGYICSCVHEWMLQASIVFLCYSLPYILRQSCIQPGNHHLCKSGRAVRTLIPCLHPSQHWGNKSMPLCIPGLCGCWGPNAGLHVYAVSTVPHELLPAPTPTRLSLNQLARLPCYLK